MCLCIFGPFFGGSKTVLFYFSVKLCFEEHGQRPMTAKYWLAILYSVVLSQGSALQIIQFLLHKAYSLNTDSLFFHIPNVVSSGGNGAPGFRYFKLAVEDPENKHFL